VSEEGALKFLGSFRVLTNYSERDGAGWRQVPTWYLVEEVDAWQEPDGTVRCVISTKDSGGVPQVLSIGRDSPASGVWCGQENDSGIRYVSQPVSRATFRRWVRQAKQFETRDRSWEQW
jgi:hypothetical protein